MTSNGTGTCTRPTCGGSIHTTPIPGRDCRRAPLPIPARPLSTRRCTRRIAATSFSSLATTTRTRSARRSSAMRRTCASTRSSIFAGREVSFRVRPTASVVVSVDVVVNVNVNDVPEETNFSAATAIDAGVEEAGLPAEGLAAEVEAVFVRDAQLALVEGDRQRGGLAREAAFEVVGPAEAKQLLLGKPRGEGEGDVGVVPDLVEQDDIRGSRVDLEPLRGLRDSRGQGRDGRERPRPLGQPAVPPV